MSDYRNTNSDYPDADNSARRPVPTDPDVRVANAAWAWIAAAIFVVIILAAAFGIGHQLGQTGTDVASNETAPPVTSPMARPAPPADAMKPPPANPAAPLSTAPNTPAHRGIVQP